MSRRGWLRRIRNAIVNPHRMTTSVQSAVAAEVLEERLMLDGVGVDAQPDFHLTDVNDTSSTSGQDVSPRDYLEEVSAWYFGHAT
ncbi:MAG: hypothetical protein VX311_03070 [Planctomycetota bacterium]|nr:hypothetical protein [Planctomycetota bacterium]MED5399813.1 hypothetical protein [Planctomycetota bacterium]MEE3283539.1 hypothetical protein [Planctomycetota bacterium]